MSEWTRPAQPVRCVVDLTAPLTVRRERGVLVQGDKNANAIVAEVYQSKGVPFDLTGSTVTLTFVRPDNLAVAPITAEITGNMAVMTLTEACYRVSGLYAASVELNKGTTDRTIVRMLGDIVSTENNGTLDEEGVFPTPKELLETLRQAETARDEANAAASKANTAASSANTAAANANKWANAEAAATQLAEGSQPTVTVTEESGKKVITFGIPKATTGATPQITFRVYTGEPGTNVKVEQSGTAENPIIDLTIPRGTPGESGASLVVDEEGNGTIT